MFLLFVLGVVWIQHIYLFFTENVWGRRDHRKTGRRTGGRNKQRASENTFFSSSVTFKSPLLSITALSPHPCPPADPTMTASLSEVRHFSASLPERYNSHHPFASPTAPWNYDNCQYGYGEIEFCILLWLLWSTKFFLCLLPITLLLSEGLKWDFVYA